MLLTIHLSLRLSQDLTYLGHADSARKICSCWSEAYWGRNSCLMALIRYEKSRSHAEASRSAATQHPK